MNAVVGMAVVALVWSLAGLARGDIEAALLPWTLPAAALAGLTWERRKETHQCD